MKKLDFKKILPHLIAIIFFAFVAVAYFSPDILEGKKLVQHDIVNGKAMQKEIVDFRNETGEEALWTNSMFSGMPAFQISVKYFVGFLNDVRDLYELYLPDPASYLMLYFIGFYILMLVLGVNPWLAIAGSFAFGFSSYYLVIIGAGHIWKVRTIAFMAPVLAGLFLILKKKYLQGGLLAAIFMTFQLFSNHIQMTYYFFILVGVILLFELYFRLKEKDLSGYFKELGVFALAVIIALGVNITNILTTYEYGEYTIRGKSELSFNNENKTGGLDRDYVTGWSYGIGESWSFLIPAAKGGASGYLGNNEVAMSKVDPQFRQAMAQQSHYWGDQPGTSGPVYMGAIILFLFLLGMFTLKWRYKWPLFVVTILVIFLSWGRNMMWFTNLFLDYFPMYDKFRSVSSILVIAELAIPIIAILGLKNFLDNPREFKKMSKHFYIALGLTAGLSFIFYLLPDTFFNFFSANELQQFDSYKIQNPGSDASVDTYMENLANARIAIFKADALRSFLFVVLAALALWLYAGSKLNKQLTIGALSVFILFDLAVVDRRYMGLDKFVNQRKAENLFTPSPADKMILQDKDPNFRVLNLAVNTFNDASTSYYHKSIGGYHGAKMQRYQDLIEYQISKNNIDVLNMLNTKYIIQADDNKVPRASRNPGALGNAWFVDSLRFVNSADDEIMALSNFDPSQTAIVDLRFKDLIGDFSPKKDTDANIQLTHYQPNKLHYKSSASREQVAVFSEIYYPAGWNVYVDKKKADHFRVNYVLRAMLIPAGKHEIEFRFEPQSYFIGEWISKIATLILVIAVGTGLYIQFRKK